MEQLSHILARIYLRPQFFIRARRITLLEAFIDGFLYARVGSQDMKAFGEFRGWLKDIKKVCPMPSLATEMMSLVEGDEAGFDEFFRLFNEFARSHPALIPAPGDIELEWPRKKRI